MRPPYKLDHSTPYAKRWHRTRRRRFLQVHKASAGKKQLSDDVRDREWWTKAVLKARGHHLPAKIQRAAAAVLAAAEKARGKR